MQATGAGWQGSTVVSEASRELMWNTGGTLAHVLMYALMLVSFVILAWGLRRRVREWQRGKASGERFGDWGKRFWILVRESLLQQQTRRRLLPAVFHSMIFYGFVILFITTLIVMLDMDFGVNVYHGRFYLGVTLAADLAGGFLLLGLLIAAARRYFARPEFLPEAKPADAAILLILAGIALTGFLAEGARIRFHPAGVDPWRAYSPIGSLFAGLLSGAPAEVGRGIHFATWWVHALGTFAMIAIIPQTKFFHILSIPTNQFFSKLAPKGSLQRVDIEELFAADDVDDDFALGVGASSHLTWKQRLDLAACIECGRCDEVCPARQVAQPLSPRRLITDTRDQLEERDPESFEIQGAEGTVFEDENFIWHCRTCHACQTLCPAGIEHVDLFTELRRSKVMMEGAVPTEAGRALKTMETQGNPFGAQAERMDLVEKLGLPVVKPGEKVEILYWIGCATTFDPEKHAIAEDMVAILKHAGVTFGHLGKDENCCGDPARLFGDENLFQTAAKQTVEALKAREFDILLVSCPHGYNVFKNEYPQFGGHFRVMHHSELLAQWLREGRLKPEQPVDARVTFHDPCYLGRYQGIYAPPRDLLRALPGCDLREMASHGDRSFCCGAGGGHFWMDIDQGEQRTYTHRVDEAVAAGAETIAVGCAFCFQMLTDGLKGRDLDETMKIVDIASLVRRSLGI